MEKKKKIQDTSGCGWIVLSVLHATRDGGTWLWMSCAVAGGIACAGWKG